MQCFLLYNRLKAVIGQTARDARMVTKCEALLLKTYGLQVPEVVEQAGNHDPDDISNPFYVSIILLYLPRSIQPRKLEMETAFTEQFLEP